MMSYILESPPPILGGTEDHTLVNIAPDIGEMHCWMFHALYDHSHLSWDDMLRIGSVGLECILAVGHKEELI